MPSPRIVLFSLVALGLLLSACTDDGSGVRTLDDSEDASGAGSGSASGSGSTSAEAECSPVGTDLAADTSVDITLRDYAFDPNGVEVEAGVVRFVATNEGSEAHELAVLPGGDAVPLTDDGDPDEEALNALGAFELEGFGPGETCEAAWSIEPGDYTLFCIIESSDGRTHYEQGMGGTLTVS